MSTSVAQGAKEQVQSFWDEDPCGAKHGSSNLGTADFFSEVEARRLELEPFIADFARFGETTGQSVLEIGAGLGSDSIRFARAGARLTAVDLTSRSIELLGRRLELEGLSAELQVADAERLPFHDDTFDVVYSWGVIHHTPDTPRAAAEAIRVLKPGGRLCVMVYGRRSWVGLGLWARYGLLRGRPTASLASVIANHMESVGTKAYTRREAADLFSDLLRVRVTQILTPYDRRVGGPLTGLLGPRLGWFLVIHGIKTASR